MAVPPAQFIDFIHLAKMKFLFLPLDRYLFRVASDNRYLPSGSKENVLSMTVIGYVTVYRSVSPYHDLINMHERP